MSSSPTVRPITPGTCSLTVNGGITITLKASRRAAGAGGAAAHGANGGSTLTNSTDNTTLAWLSGGAGGKNSIWGRWRRWFINHRNKRSHREWWRLVFRNGGSAIGAGSRVALERNDDVRPGGTGGVGVATAAVTVPQAPTECFVWRWRTRRLVSTRKGFTGTAGGGGGGGGTKFGCARLVCSLAATTFRLRERWENGSGAHYR